MKKEKYWNRKCKAKGCYGIARPLSDYCSKCYKKRKKENAI